MKSYGFEMAQEHNSLIKGPLTPNSVWKKGYSSSSVSVARIQVSVEIGRNSKFTPGLRGGHPAKSHPVTALQKDLHFGNCPGST